MHVAIGQGTAALDGDKLRLDLVDAFDPRGLPKLGASRTRRDSVEAPYVRIAGTFAGGASFGGGEAAIIGVALDNGTNLLGVRQAGRMPAEQEIAGLFFDPARRRLDELPPDYQLGQLFVCGPDGRWRDARWPESRLLGLFGSRLSTQNSSLSQLHDMGEAALAFGAQQLPELAVPTTPSAARRSARRLRPFLDQTQANSRTGAIAYAQGLARATLTWRPHHVDSDRVARGVDTAVTGGELAAGTPLGLVPLAAGVVLAASGTAGSSGVGDFRRTEMPMKLTRGGTVGRAR